MPVRVMSWDEFGPDHYRPPLGTAKKYPVEWRKANVFDLGKRDGWVCVYCGVGLESKGGMGDDPEKLSPTVDHVVPRKRGGGDTNYNAVLACMPCNRSKGYGLPFVRVA